jgi:hypothetical protein
MTGTKAESDYERSLEKPGFCYTLATIAPEKSLASGLVAEKSLPAIWL